MLLVKWLWEPKILLSTKIVSSIIVKLQGLPVKVLSQKVCEQYFTRILYPMWLLKPSREALWGRKTGYCSKNKRIRLSIWFMALSPNISSNPGKIRHSIFLSQWMNERMNKRMHYYLRVLQNESLNFLDTIPQEEILNVAPRKGRRRKGQVRVALN